MEAWMQVWTESEPEKQARMEALTFPGVQMGWALSWIEA